MPPPPLAPAECRAEEPAPGAAMPGELENPQAAAHRGIHFELQELTGRPADVEELDDEHSAYKGAGGRSRATQPAGESRWYAGVYLDDPIGFMKSFDRTLASGMGAGRGDGGELGESPQWQGAVGRLQPVRKRPAERLALAIIFASFVAVAALVGIICVSSLDAAYQEERNTENLLHDARAFVPANPGGTLPVDSFEDVQQSGKNLQVGPELNKLYNEFAHHSLAGHDFDVAFVTGGETKGQVSLSSPGRMQALAGVPRPVRAIEAHLPTHHVHGKRVWRWLNRNGDTVRVKQSSNDISESLSKQADYIIGYPDLEEKSPARTEGLVQTPHGSRIVNSMHMLLMPQMHSVQSLSPMPPLGGNHHSENVMNAQQVCLLVSNPVSSSPLISTRARGGEGLSSRSSYASNLGDNKKSSQR